MRNRWYHVPILHTALDHEKKVSWLELFYDLIFVAAIIQLGDTLSGEVSRSHDALGPLAKFAGLMVPLWVAWTGFTLFFNRFDVDDFIQRGLVFLKMFSVGAMAIAVPAAMRGDLVPFALGYAAAQLLVAIMYLRSWRQVPEAAPYSRYWGLVFAIGAVFWLISVPLPAPYSFAFMGLGVAAILFAPVSKQSRALTERFPIDFEHLSERYGLLTIIVLGESFVKVLSMLAAEQAVSVELLGKGTLVLLVTCCIWWIYFDDVAGSRVRKDRGAWIMWLYGHLPLAVGITAVAVGVKKAVGFDFGQVAPDEYRWLLACAVSITFFAVAIIDSVTERRQAELSDKARVNVRFGSALLVLLLAPAGATMSAGMFLLLVTAICVAQVLFDLMMAPLDARSLPEHIDTTAEIARRRMSGEQPTRLEARPDITNVVRKGTPPELKRDLYFFFIEGSWTRFLLSLGFVYVVANVFFAALYLLEPRAIDGAGAASFGDAFSFSVQTMSTIGYGVLSPATEYGNLLVAIEAAFGLAAVALATGLMFAKASRPRSSVLFSKHAVVTTRHGDKTLMFRAGNARGNEVVDATMSVSALFDEISPEGHHLRRIVDLSLVRDRSPLFSLSWSAMHVIDESSPLSGLDFEEPGHDLGGIIVTMLGHDGTYGSTTYARHVYWPEDIRVDHRFVDVVHQLEDGRLLVDFTKFHDTVPDEHALREHSGLTVGD